jgi:hypothetical protein
VAGNLAARHDIRITLDNSPGNGITATIDLPPTLLTSDEDLGPELTPPHGYRTVSPAPVSPALATAATPPPPVPGPAPRRPDGQLEVVDLAPDPPAPAPPAPGPVAPAPPAPRPTGPFAPPPSPGPTAPAPTARTQSGLVKRGGRSGAESTTLGAGRPSGELLDALSRHTASLRQAAPGAEGGTGGRRPAPPPPSPAPPAPGRGPVGPSPADLPSPPVARLPTRRASSPPPSPPPHAAPAPTSSGAPGEPGATGGGLTRRVRGAQMPTTSPLQLRRSDGTPHADGSPAPDPGPPVLRPPASPSWAPAEAAPPAGQRSERADNVYGFLSSFSAGVQRGLDQAQRERHDPGGDGWR